jgi:multiple sugar transport system substrate-binding protein
MLFINTKALSDAGLTLDDVDTSDWTKISELNDKLTKKDGDTLTRIGFDPKLPEFLPLWAKANGADLLSADGKTAQLDDPKVIEALDFASKLHEAAGGRQNFTAFRDTWDFFGAQNQIVSDQLGVFPMEQWYMNVLADSSPDAPIAYKPFTDKEGNPISFVTGNAWAIPKGAANPEAACAFAKTMTSVDAWVAAAQARADLRAKDNKINTGVYTGNIQADEKIFADIVKPSGNEAIDNGIQTILSVQDTAFATAANPAGSEFKQAWTDAVNRVLNGEQTAEESLKQAQQEAQAALDAAWAKVGNS